MEENMEKEERTEETAGEMTEEKEAAAAEASEEMGSTGEELSLIHI